MSASNNDIYVQIYLYYIVRKNRNNHDERVYFE